jgi:hypothetical protein
MFELAIEAAKALVGSAEALNKLGNERREKLATYFDSTAQVMRTYVVAIENGEEPPPLCEKLSKLASKMRELTKSTLPSDEVDSLLNEFENACLNWKKLDFPNAGEHSTNKDLLRNILSTAGSFEGEAILLRAASS